MDIVIDVVDKVKTQLLPVIFPFWEIDTAYSVETLESAEFAINQMFPLGHVPMPTTLIPFAIHLGETIVQNIPGAHWVDGPFVSWEDMRIDIPMSHGHSFVYPYRRVHKFWFDRTDGLAVMFRMFRDVHTGVVDLASVTPGDWLEFPRSDGSVDRYRFHLDSQVN